MLCRATDTLPLQKVDCSAAVQAFGLGMPINCTSTVNVRPQQTQDGQASRQHLHKFKNWHGVNLRPSPATGRRPGHP